jgi:hypothetical protein
MYYGVFSLQWNVTEALYLSSHYKMSSWFSLQERIMKVYIWLTLLIHISEYGERNKPVNPLTSHHLKSDFWRILNNLYYAFHFRPQHNVYHSIHKIICWLKLKVPVLLSQATKEIKGKTTIVTTSTSFW